MSNTWESRLTAIDDVESAAAWSAFFLNESAVVEFLRSTPPTIVSATLAAGAPWAGAGWDTTKSAKAVRTLTNIAMVTNEVKDYLHAFLFSLALVTNVDVLDLSDKASDVAFKLADRWQQLLGMAGPSGPELRAGRDTGEESEEDEEPRLPWEEEAVQLPEDLKVILERLQAGGRAEVRRLLEQVPVFRGLKARSEDNNHKAESKGTYDKLLKSSKQRLLNLGRVQVALHSLLRQVSPEAVVLSQMQWMYMMETENLILKERKKASIPASVAESGNALFSMEDLKHEKQVMQINRAGYGMFPTGYKWSYFQTVPGLRSWKFRPGKGRGKPAVNWQWQWNAKGAGRKGKGGSSAGKSTATVADRVYGRHFKSHGGTFSGHKHSFHTSFTHGGHCFDRKTGIWST